jgi:hypothetical protein
MEAGIGSIMFRIIYCLLLLGISICSMASVMWLLSFVGFELLLVAGGCVVAFASSVTLLEELVEWRVATERHRRSKDQADEYWEAMHSRSPTRARERTNEPGQHLLWQ